MLVCMLAVALVLWPFLGECLSLLGAQGETHALALRYARQVLPTAPLIGMGMCCSALLRAVGDARGAMGLTLVGGAASAVLDPLCIFGLGLGLDGAALSQWCARSLLVLLGLWLVLRKHDLLRLPHPATLRETLPAFMAIGLPAVLTQIATPVGNAFVTHAIAPFGDGAVAGWSVVVRLIPVAFVVLFALSGAIGPIVGQNLGAARFDRLRDTLRQSLVLVVAYVAVVWLLLALGANLIADAFGAQGEAREVIVFFCRFVAGSFVFNGALFVANAAFNNLGFAFYSTALNWGRATLGVAPFVWLGAAVGGTHGIMAGYGLGVVGFGTPASGCASKPWTAWALQLPRRGARALHLGRFRMQNANPEVGVCAMRNTAFFWLRE